MHFLMFAERLSLFGALVMNPLPVQGRIQEGASDALSHLFFLPILVGYYNFRTVFKALHLIEMKSAPPKIISCFLLFLI